MYKDNSRRLYKLEHKARTKILIHIPQLIYGGAEKVLVNFANYLAAHGNEVEVLETYEKGLLKHQFDRGVSFNAICSNDYTNRYYASLTDIKKEKNPAKLIVKVLKLCFSKIVGYRRFAEKLAAKHYKNKEYDVAINYLEIEDPKFVLDKINADKYIQWIHTDAAKLSEGKLDIFLENYERMDWIVCVAETAKQAMSELYPNLNKKLKVLYNFFDVNSIVSRAEEEKVFCDDSLSILSIGRMVEEQKAYLRALRVINKLILDGYKFKWYIMGDGVDRKAVENEIKKAKLEDVVILLGQKDNPYPYIKNCSLFFLPSLCEGFPTVTMEAKILKKPVLSTEVSGIREQIVSGKQGLIVDNSENGIYEGLKYILDNPELLNILSDNSGMDAVLDNDIKYEKFMELVKEV